MCIQPTVKFERPIKPSRSGYLNPQRKGNCPRCWWPWRPVAFCLGYPQVVLQANTGRVCLPSLPRLACLLMLDALFVCGFASPALAQHDHPASTTRRTAPPKVFLDKSPRVVEYQLQRLSNEQLLLIETNSSDKKYLPVFAAILSREGMTEASRIAALDGLVAINQSNRVAELAQALRRIKWTEPSAERTLRLLAGMLLKIPPAELLTQAAALNELATSREALIAPMGFAALLSAGSTSAAFELAAMHQSLPWLLDGIQYIPSQTVRNALHGQVLAATAEAAPEAQRRAAVEALAYISSEQPETFRAVVPLVELESLREPAIKTLLTIEPTAQEQAQSQTLVGWLVDFAEATPAADRTSDSFLDAMQLVEQLLVSIPAEEAKAFRTRLRETMVRVVRIRTVEEEMRYDLPYFAVEAGRPVQVVLINQDMMPHNLVITSPGALKEIAELGLQVGPAGGSSGKQYVPDSDQVLFATDMVNAQQQTSLTFNAPAEPGEYPYVCTFPRHWMRMYGVMVVVEDLDAWLKHPTTPTDPVGSNRSFVQNWTIDDFAELESGLRGRSPEIGKRLFVEASCAQCHRAGDLLAGDLLAGDLLAGNLMTGNVGPDLSGVMARWKGSQRDVLLEILEPSHRIDPKYVVEIVLTEAGQTLTGLVTDESDDTISLLENPEAAQPTVIPQSEIAGRRKTGNSMMPKGLLDRFSRDEIYEILAYIQSIQQAPPDQ